MPRAKKPDSVDSRFAETESRLNALEGRSQDHSWTVALAILMAVLAIKVWFYPSQSTASANAINVHRWDIDNLEKRINHLDDRLDTTDSYLWMYNDKVLKIENKLWPKPTPVPTPVPKPCVPAP